MNHSQLTKNVIRAAVIGTGIAALLACSSHPVQQATQSSNQTTGGSMTVGQSANQTGVVPDERVSWVKNPLITQIRFHRAVMGRDYIEIRYFLSYINPSDRDVKWTAMPTPDGPHTRLYLNGKRILPAPVNTSDIEPYKAAPRDDEIRANASVVHANETWTTAGPAEFVILNTQFLPG
ncbi:MAG TPA: hypothetical protein VF573_21010, partial [Paraburkholderia sp.]